MSKSTKIIYVGSYSDENNDIDNRIVFPAAQTKCDYITKVIKNFNVNIKIVSCPVTKNKKGFLKSKKGVNSNKVEYIIGPTFGVKTVLGKKVQKLFSRIWLFLYLLIYTKKHTKVIVYHSPSVIFPVRLTHKIKKYELILEVEELYSSFPQISDRFKRKELKFINTADKYIFVSELLQRKINVNKKPFVISYGAYMTDIICSNVESQKIHLVYAGTFDMRKRGAFNAIEACQYLDGKYVLHVLGFGSDSEIKKIKAQIENSNKKNKCEIIYEGCLMGEEYNNILKKCSIGISTQNIHGEYNLTSFPSKILVYISHGLEVVATRIKVLEESKLNGFIHYVESNDPKEIAMCIMSISTSRCSKGVALIKKLDLDFSKDMKKLLIGE